MRIIAQLLVLLVVTSSTLAAVPCACEAPGTHSEIEQVASDANGGCCAGSTEESPDENCPHCLTGACEIEGVSVDDDTLVVAATGLRVDLAFESRSATGFEPRVEWTPRLAHESNSRGAVAPASGWGTCVRNQVIRC